MFLEIFTGYAFKRTEYNFVGFHPSLDDNAFQNYVLPENGIYRKTYPNETESGSSSV